MANCGSYTIPFEWIHCTIFNLQMLVYNFNFFVFNCTKKLKGLKNCSNLTQNLFI